MFITDALEEGVHCLVTFLSLVLTNSLSSSDSQRSYEKVGKKYL